MSEVKKFTTLGREQVPFEVDDKKYVIKQASAAASRQYREASLVGTEMELAGKDDQEKTVIKKIQAVAGVEPLLVSLCTFDDSNKPVGLNVVDSWPGDITKWAFGEIKRISPWLDEKDDDLPGLTKKRDELTKRIAKLEAVDPKS